MAVALHNPDRIMPVGDAPKPRPMLEMVWLDDVKPCLDTRDFVEGVLADGQMSVLYGESNCGKTFFATDRGLHVALGWEWRGRAVEQGPVLYVAAESWQGVVNRASAFRQHHGLTCDIPFAIIKQQVNLLDPNADMPKLLANIAAVTEKFGRPPRLVTIDTLSRAMAGGNENSPEDMGALVRNADHIRLQTGCHLEFIHHSGKDTAKGARGHSLVRAGTDTETEVTKQDGTSIARVTKQREMACEGEWAFRLEVVELGTNQRGKPVTSCVVVPAEASSADPESRLTKNQQTMFSILHEAGSAGLTSEEWNERARRDGLGVSRRADLRDFRVALKSKGLVKEYGEKWVAER